MIEQINKYEVASIAAINNLEGDNFQKLTAAKQRELFGTPILGRKSVNFDPANQGVVRILFSKAFGTTSQVKQLSYAQFAAYCNEQRSIEE